MLGIEHLGFWYKGTFYEHESYKELVDECKPIVEKFIKEFLRSEKGKQNQWIFHWATLVEIPNLVVFSINDHVTVRLDPNFTCEEYRLNVENVLNKIIENGI